MAARSNPAAPYWIAMEKREREIIEGALELTGGDVTRAARSLGIDRTYLTRIIKRLGIDRSDYALEASP